MLEHELENNEIDLLRVLSIVNYEKLESPDDQEIAKEIREAVLAALVFQTKMQIPCPVTSVLTRKHIFFIARLLDE